MFIVLLNMEIIAPDIHDVSVELCGMENENCADHGRKINTINFALFSTSLTNTSLEHPPSVGLLLRHSLEKLKNQSDLQQFSLQQQSVSCFFAVAMSDVFYSFFSLVP